MRYLSRPRHSEEERAVIEAAGTKPKLIEEFQGITVVRKGSLRVAFEGGDARRRR